MLGDVFSIIFAFVGIIVVLVLAYYVSRWYAKRVGPITGGRYIKIIDRLVVSKSSQILILEIEQEQYLIGVSDQGIRILKKIDEPIEIAEAEPYTGLGFKELLEKYQKWRGEDKDGYHR